MRSSIEAAGHLLFWAFIFAAVNVDWGSDWLDRSIRPDTPSPFSVLIFPLLFYAHAFWAIPAYLKPGKYARYLGCIILIFILPEVIRSLLFAASTDVPVALELKSRDSLLIGSPMTAWLAFILSTGYRFTKDWFLQRDWLSVRSGRAEPLEAKEAELLQNELQKLMEKEMPYMDSGLTLNSLSRQLNIPAKTLSKLLNQHLDTGFSDFVNSHRVRHFIERVKDGDLENLSIAGLAMQSGFSSKTSFYRAFKKSTGTTPSDYLKKLQ